MPYGRVVSVRARGPAAEARQEWALETQRPAYPRSSPERMWPRPGEELHTTRRSLPSLQPPATAGLWVARADALPQSWAPTPATLVWCAGSRTWQKLAAAGVWVHGCADGLGDSEGPAVDALIGQATEWVRLTHVGGVTREDTVATYAAETTLPSDLPSRTHFFWMSGSLFTKAIERWPELRNGWHGSGPGRTHQVIAAALGSSGRAGVWLERESWEKETCQ